MKLYELRQDPTIRVFVDMGRSVLHGLFSLCFGAAGIWLALSRSPSGSDLLFGYIESTFAGAPTIIVYATGIVFCMIGLNSLWKAFDVRPLAEIGPDGVHFCQKMRETVPWSAISRIEFPLRAYRSSLMPTVLVFHFREGYRPPYRNFLWSAVAHALHDPPRHTLHLPRGDAWKPPTLAIERYCTIHEV